MHAPDLLMIQEAEDQDICTVTRGAMDMRRHDNARRQARDIQELALAIQSQSAGVTGLDPLRP